jgi:hypothetical protein
MYFGRNAQQKGNEENMWRFEEAAAPKAIIKFHVDIR